MESQCEVCKKSAHLKCCGCLAVHYCSSAHQNEHWKSHQMNCSYFVIRDDPVHGKGFYASRDIKAGTIIHEENAFVFTPHWFSDDFDDFAPCVGCGVRKQRHFQLPLKKCSRCNWPYCSPECLQIHANNECKIFVSKQVIFPPVSKIQVQDIPDLILMIRTAVAKKKNPEIFQAIMQFRSESDGPVEADGLNAEVAVEQTLGRISAYIDAEDLQISKEELKKLLKILRINSHNTVCRNMLEKLFSPAPLANYVYAKASQMQHSCIPNCSWDINWKPEFQIRVRTTLQVKKGEALKISYYLSSGIKSRMDRVHTIRMRLGQWCKCSRCNDPTELGTFESAVVCINKACKKNKGSVGYMLPGDPLSLYFSSHWRCNFCGVTKADVNGEQQKIKEILFKKQLQLRSLKDLGAFIQFCMKVICENSGKTVHPNNWIMQYATNKILEYLPVYHKGSMNLQTSQYYVKKGLYLLAIQDVVSPGISYHRAVLQKQIAAALQDQVKDLCSQKKYKDALSNLEESLKLQEEALAYFKDDFRKDPDDISDADELRIAINLAAQSMGAIESMFDKELKCAICGKQAYQNCPHCHVVTYCSTDHRQKHWKSHKECCSCFVIKEGSGNGNGFFALRNIKAGTVILEETPVLYGPSWHIPDFHLMAFCVTCGFGFEQKDLALPKIFCSKCNWPSCSLGCDLIHNENECRIFELAGGKLNFPPRGYFTPGEVRDLLLLIRATILRKKNPGIYQQILELRSESTKPNQNDFDLKKSLHLLRPIINLDGADIDPEEFKKLFKILRMNCYPTLISIQINENTVSTNFGTEYVYLKATKLEQSCAPNCSWEITPSPDFKIRIRATEKVKEGEALTINYNVRGYWENTRKRQETIGWIRGTSCDCERCKDPTELGTMATAITCNICRETIGTSNEFPYFLPEDPLDFSDSAKWKCNRCGLVKLSSVILPPVQRIQDLISKKAKECYEVPQTLVEYCKIVIKVYSGRSVHPNHWVIQDAATTIFRLLPLRCGGLIDLEASQYYVKCGLYLLAIQDVISPGLTFSRAILQKQIGIALHNQNKELQSQNRHKEASDNLQHCLKLLAEAVDYYRCVEGDGGRNAAELEQEIHRVTAASMELKKALETKGNILVP